MDHKDFLNLNFKENEEGEEEKINEEFITPYVVVNKTNHRFTLRRLNTKDKNLKSLKKKGDQD